MPDVASGQTPSLEEVYQRRHDSVLRQVSNQLEALLFHHLENLKGIDRISVRAKAVERFLEKAARQDRDGAKYTDPLRQIQDQVGARVVVLHLRDVELVADELRRLFRQIEERDLVPETHSTFGYFGKHFIFALPADAIPYGIETTAAPSFFECQVKTLFQHAWSEANHDIGYKPPCPLTEEQHRMLAYAAAQAWGADQIFDGLVKEIRGQ